MHRWPRIAGEALALGALGAVCACGVPDVSFAPVDGSTETVTTPAEAGVEGGLDTGVESGVEAGDTEVESGVEAGDGAASIDGATVTCPASPPVGTSLCCGTIPCGGTCHASDCTQCSACMPSEVCCVHGQGVSCHASLPCP
jgi:hypothetical protein